MSNKLIKGAFYRHYKNKKIYKVIEIVRHSESLEEMVLYEAQYENEFGPLWVRPLNMFLENVEVDGKKVPRFTPLNPAN